MANLIVTTTADSGAGSLRAAIASATAGSTIQFAANLANQTITLTSGQLEITAGKNITIDGSAAAGLSISGNNSSRIFLVRSNQTAPTTIAFKNLALINGYTAENGGAIQGEHKANITVEAVKFQNNVADKGGGAIYSAWENQLTVNNSQFDSNKATAGNDERGAGAIAFVSAGKFTVRDSSFTNNAGINGGAINSLNGKLTIENSRFINNNTLAGQYADGKGNPTLRGYGGALYTDRASSTNEPSGTIRISGTVFEGNKGRAEGGAAYLYTGAQDSVTIQSSTFKDNDVQSLAQGNGGNGGGLVVISNSPNQGLTIAQTSFINNTAASQGGGIWVMGAPATILNSTFSGNQATGTVPGKVVGTDYYPLGGAMSLYSEATIMNSTIAYNRAAWVGGAISTRAEVSLQNTILYNNTADNGGNNWGIQQHTSGTLTDKGGNIQFPAEKDNKNATTAIKIIDPMLGALQDNGSGILTHALLPGSPAINKGAATGAPTIDQRGFARTDGSIDIGAIEFGATTLITGTPIAGTKGNDVLTGSDTNDWLTGGMGSDKLTGGGGVDRFIYAGASQRAAFAGSRMRNPDRILDFNAVQGDRLELDYDNNPVTGDRPRGLFNAGKVKGGNLRAGVQAAFRDKNHKRKGNQNLRANEAVVFQWRKQTFLAANDTGSGFAPKRDMIINVTGLQMLGQDATAGALNVSNYFV
jgi:predicted outer membrane repeat protein